MSDAPLRIGHPDGASAPDPCGCCEGTALATAQPTLNRPNLTAIAFRAGDHATFKASMLTGLATAAHPALQALRTREDDDFTIALVDAWAAACDVLTFYQERLANEAYTGTATERLSIGELARLIGYRLHPGAAAETDLVLLMEDPPGAEADIADLTVPAGTRVQSQPGPDETPQVFETLADLDARVAWNALHARQSRMIGPELGDTGIWLDGDQTGLRRGDPILIVGRRRGDPEAPDFDAGSENWDFRFVVEVAPDTAIGKTWVAFDRPLGSLVPLMDPARADHRVYVLRERASFFGYNAPDPKLLPVETRNLYGYGTSSSRSGSVITGNADNPGDWHFRTPGIRWIALDRVYPGFVAGSWVVLSSEGYGAELYRIEDTVEDGMTQYALSGRATRLVLDTDENLDRHEAAFRTVSVYGNAEELPRTETPIRDWVSGDQVEVAGRPDDLPEGRRLMVRGRRARLAVNRTRLAFVGPAGPVDLPRDARVTLLAAPQPVPGGTLDRYRVVDPDGIAGHIDAASGALVPVPAETGIEEVAEPATLDRVEAVDGAHGRLVLTDPLSAAFDRASVVIHANVARAGHGEGATEILGHGDPGRPFQKFALKQAPVTHRLAPTETGIESTLSIRIDGVEWQEVRDLHDRGAARVFKTSLTDAGETVVEFGDGVSGARPPAGRDNIVAEHSRGVGIDGNLRAGQLKLPLDRPLGLKEVTNPLPATGGAAPEAAEDARRNAPIHTLTLGRIVSLTDYRDFALGFPGIAKAEARWVWQGESRRVVVTVAGDRGAVVLPGTATHDNLLAAFRDLGDPLVAVDLLSYAPATFRLGLRATVATDHDSDAVLSALEAHLRAAFGFASRDFGEVLNLSEISAAAHAVAGLAAVRIDTLARTTAPQTALTAHARLISQPGRRAPDGTLLPAEILTLAPGPLHKLEVTT